MQLNLKNSIILLLAWLVVYSLLGLENNFLPLLNLLSLIIIMFFCLGNTIYLLKRNTIAIWSPYTGFLISGAVYYGFGPLLYYLGRQETINYANAIYSVDPPRLYKINILVLIGLLVVSLVYEMLGHQRKFLNPIDGKNNLKFKRNLWISFAVLAFIGFTLRFFYVVPSWLLKPGVIVPGIIISLSEFSIVSIIPIFLIYKNSKSKRMLLVLVMVILANVISGILLFNKTIILKSFLALILGMALRKISLKRVLSYLFFCFLIYAVLLVPLITVGRIVIDPNGIRSSISMNNFLGVLRSGSIYETYEEKLPRVQMWWVRANYANAQAFAIDSYEANIMKGRTIKQALFAFVPRFIYPEKPDLAPGDIFNEAMTGNSLSKSSPGMLVEGYWNYGLMGVILVALVLGLVFVGWERYIFKRTISSEFIFLPVMWNGVFLGLYQDGWFVPNVFGSIVISIFLNFFLLMIYDLLNKLIKRGNKPRLNKQRAFLPGQI